MRDTEKAPKKVTVSVLTLVAQRRTSGLPILQTGINALISNEPFAIACALPQYRSTKDVGCHQKF